MTTILLIANCAVALLSFAEGVRSGSGQDLMRVLSGSATDGFVTKFGLIPVAVSRYHQWYRLFSSMFIHSGILHLLCNMYALYSYGPLIESSLGWVRMGIIYILSGLAGDLLIMLFGSADTVTVGASGAIFGLIGAAFALALLSRRMRVIRSIGMVIAANLLITFSRPGISIGGHVGGLAGGLVLGFLFGLLSRR